MNNDNPNLNAEGISEITMFERCKSYLLNIHSSTENTQGREAFYNIHTPQEKHPVKKEHGKTR